VPRPPTLPGCAPGARVAIADSDVRFWAAAFADVEASQLFDELLTGIAWRQEEVLIFGQPRLVPRLVAWHGDPQAEYTYSGTPHVPTPWTPPLERIRTRIASLTGHDFNGVLLNRYRDGRDGMGWHADDEPELGRDPVIASVSLGAPRRFSMRHRRRKDQRYDVLLTHGSLLLMAGPTQHHWLHALPKTAAAVGQRINLTFRRVTPT
jgi:alkylated DNA repair dioxygenase AlkB